jgi:hypothetical protein
MSLWTLLQVRGGGAQGVGVTPLPAATGGGAPLVAAAPLANRPPLPARCCLPARLPAGHPADQQRPGHPQQ